MVTNELGKANNYFQISRQSIWTGGLQAVVTVQDQQTQPEKEPTTIPLEEKEMSNVVNDGMLAKLLICSIPFAPLFLINLSDF